jgi:hypothetical protein
VARKHCIALRILQHTQRDNWVPTKTLLHKRADVREFVGEVRKSTLLHNLVHLLMCLGLHVRVYKHRQEERIQDGDTLSSVQFEACLWDSGPHRICTREVHYRRSALCDHLLYLARLQAFCCIFHFLKKLLSYRLL